MKISLLKGVSARKSEFTYGSLDGFMEQCEDVKVWLHTVQARFQLKNMYNLPLMNNMGFAGLLRGEDQGPCGSLNGASQ